MAQDIHPAAFASVLGALGGGINSWAFKYKKRERHNPLNYLNRDGQIWAVNGQFVVVDGQKTLAILAKK